MAKLVFQDGKSWRVLYSMAQNKEIVETRGHSCNLRSPEIPPKHLLFPDLESWLWSTVICSLVFGCHGLRLGSYPGADAEIYNEAEFGEGSLQSEV